MASTDGGSAGLAHERDSHFVGRPPRARSERRRRSSHRLHRLLRTRPVNSRPTSSPIVSISCCGLPAFRAEIPSGRCGWLGNDSQRVSCRNAGHTSAPAGLCAAELPIRLGFIGADDAVNLTSFSALLLLPLLIPLPARASTPACSLCLPSSVFPAHAAIGGFGVSWTAGLLRDLPNNIGDAAWKSQASAGPPGHWTVLVLWETRPPALYRHFLLICR